MTVHPLHGRMVGRRVEDATAKEGIVMPDTAEKKPREGEVLAAGNGTVGDNGTRVAPKVRVGDRALFRKALRDHQDR